MSTTQDTKQIATPPPEGVPGSDVQPARLIIALGIAGFVSGLVLVGTYLFTLPMIQANKAEALRTAIYEVLPGTASFETLMLQDGRLVPVDGTPDSDVPHIFAGYTADGDLAGFAIPSEEAGYQDIIAGIFGYDPQKKEIVGFKVLESKETPGLGDKIIKDQNFLNNFRSLSVEPEVVTVKSGEKKNPNEVDAITGATISSKAVVRLLNKGVEQWQGAIEQYIK